MRKTFCGLMVVGLWHCLGSQDLRAQGFGRPDPAMIFGFLDRNGDGRLDRDEIENSRGPMRERLQQLRIDYSRGLSRDDFVRVLERAREGEASGDFTRGREEERFRFEEGREGFFGPRPEFGQFGRGEERWRYESSSEGDRRRSEEERSSRDGDSRNSSSRSRSGTPPPAPKPRITIDLQPTFKEGDKDGDGQVGWYEWRQWKGRAAAAEFARLDLNGDGFLTPWEIQQATSTPAATAVATGTPSAAPNGLATSRTTAPPQSPPLTATTATVPVSRGPAVDHIVINEDDANVRRYRNQFRELDEDGDGQLTAVEWERSVKIRQRFVDAGIDLKQPMDGDTFVRYLLHLDAQSAS